MIKSEQYRLRLLRKHLNKTQIEFSEELGLTQGGYSDIERGKSGISPDVLRQLIINYKINPLWLFIGEEPMFWNNPLPAKSENVNNELKLKVELLENKIAALENEKRLLEKIVTMYEKKQN